MKMFPYLLSTHMKNTWLGDGRIHRPSYSVAERGQPNDCGTDNFMTEGKEMKRFYKEYDIEILSSPDDSGQWCAFMDIRPSVKGNRGLKHLGNCKKGGFATPEVAEAALWEWAKIVIDRGTR